MSRTILVHLNVTVPEGDDRSMEEIVAAIEGALEVGSDDESVRSLEIVTALAEEI